MAEDGTGRLLWSGMLLEDDSKERHPILDLGQGHLDNIAWHSCGPFQGIPRVSNLRELWRPHSGVCPLRSLGGP